MAAFVEIVCLWIAIAITIAQFALVEPPATALLAPYLAWVTFAAALNLCRQPKPRWPPFLMPDAAAMIGACPPEE